MKTIDARGISCPEPLLMLKSALKDSKDAELLVDSKNAYTNCKEYAEKQGFTVDVSQKGDVYTLRIKSRK